jgi:lipopolysaccharide/colanic/teichoic acid biosynthesis glycosyltransferase
MFLLLVLLGISAFDTGIFSLFKQSRIGKNANKFTLYKLRTIHPKTQTISSLGKLLRKYKLDELPQLINIINGTMSFVGPRPDIPGYADKLTGDDQVILNIRPGVTGLASIKYRNEEQLLASQMNPQDYNDTIIWPDKVRINKWYAENYTFILDIKILWYTLIPVPLDIEQFMKDNTKS